MRSMIMKRRIAAVDGVALHARADCRWIRHLQSQPTRRRRDVAEQLPVGLTSGYGFLTETVVAGLPRIFEPLFVIRCHIPDFRGGCSAASISRSKEY